MSETRETGDPAAVIGARLAEIQAHYYGRPPSGYRAHILPDSVVVILRETFTPAEMILVKRGEAEGIQDIRRRFQQAVRSEFTEIVEQVTGKAVAAFMSDTDLEANICVEVFVLGDGRENMEAFEQSMTDPDATSGDKR
jgi:uncharacterized protein YbcI